MCYLRTTLVTMITRKRDICKRTAYQSSQAQDDADMGYGMGQCSSYSSIEDVTIYIEDAQLC